MLASLKDRSFVTALDPKGMLALTDAFPQQVKLAVESAQGIPLPTRTDFRLVMLTGLGGSAAGGDFARGLFDAFGSTPFLVNRDYNLPAYIGKEDLVFCTSYSGNTEETLSAFHDAEKAGSTIICVTSGGKLADLAKQGGHTLILVQGGQPPRTALGFMLMPVVVACEGLGLLPKQDYAALVAELEVSVRKWTVEGSEDQPKEIAEDLHGALGVIYGLGSWPGLIANRWKGQINENSKNLILNNVFPELNHNEILGWVQADEQNVDRYVGILLEDGTESEKMKTRFEVTQELVKDLCTFHRVKVDGDSLLAKLLNMALYGDYVSLYLAALNKVDPENIDSINILKSKLGKIA